MEATRSSQVMLSKPSSVSPRRSPPPLVSMEPRRDSLVGLQRLVYNTTQVNDTDKQAVKSTFDDDSTKLQDPGK